MFLDDEFDDNCGHFGLSFVCRGEGKGWEGGREGGTEEAWHTHSMTIMPIEFVLRGRRDGRQAGRHADDNACEFACGREEQASRQAGRRYHDVEFCLPEEKSRQTNRHGDIHEFCSRERTGGKKRGDRQKMMAILSLVSSTGGGRAGRQMMTTMMLLSFFSPARGGRQGDNQVSQQTGD